MITQLLLRLGLALVDLDHVARQLASAILRDHNVDVLDEHGTRRELQRRYAILATDTGLPIAAQRTVALAAWRYVAAARGLPTVASKEFSFYW